MGRVLVSQSVWLTPNASSFSLDVPANPGTAGLWRYARVTTDYGTAVVRYVHGSKTALVKESTLANRTLTPTFDGSTLTLDFSATMTGGLRVEFLD